MPGLVEPRRSLAQRYHIIAPDLRGHVSGKPDGGYTFADAIADLEALMDHLGWYAANIVGHSWTGKLAGLGNIRTISEPDPSRSVFISTAVG